MPNLANRLAVHACLDLEKSCPLTIKATVHWLHQVGFWLAELSRHPASPDQLWAMVGRLAQPYAWAMGMSLPQACQVLKEHLILHQMLGDSKEAAKS